MNDVTVAGRARLVPVYFESASDPEFTAGLTQLSELLAGEAEILEPQPLGSRLPEADAALFPQMTGDGYRRTADFQSITIPILVLTSEFGTMAMWDWELIAYLGGKGVEILAPYDLEDARTVCRALAVRRQLKSGKFLVYQDHPGVGGKQPEIFKRFYWWEDECSQRMREKFGLTIEKRSFRELGGRAKEIPDARAREELERVRGGLPMGDVTERATLAALKLYLAVRDDLEQEPNVLSTGINCLNESGYSDTTPCLAWDLLYQERDMIWGCEADTVSMLTHFLMHRSLRLPIMMSNLYPFLMGQAALKHERIPAFPTVDEPENHVLAAHCGYLGVLPRPMATEWKLRGKVLAIVGDNSAVHDARLPLGDLTLAKLDPTFDKLVAVDAELSGYAGYPGSDCVNGAVIRVPDGHALMRGLPSHHSLLMAGHARAGVDLIGSIFDLDIVRLES
jgi:hypothetical protein